MRMFVKELPVLSGLHQEAMTRFAGVSSRLLPICYHFTPLFFVIAGIDSVLRGTSKDSMLQCILR